MKCRHCINQATSQIDGSSYCDFHYNEVADKIAVYHTKETEMSHMSRLAYAIQENTVGEEEHQQITDEINRHLHDEIKFEDMSTKAQNILFEWEKEEQELANFERFQFKRDV